jgi:sigma-B regulation protein RsbU (phosphoserine phosphatase)
VSVVRGDRKTPEENRVEPRHVLLVDDSEADRQLYRALLSATDKGDYVFCETGNPGDGLAHCREQTFDCVLVDYHMPMLDGLEFLLEIRRDGATADIPIIMLTGDCTETVVNQAMRHGAIDYLDKNAITGATLAQAVNNAIIKARLRRELSVRHEQARAELEEARELQRSIIPARDVWLGPVHFVSNYQPAHFVAGDMFNYFWLDSEHIGFYVADVAGHGVAAAMYTLWLNHSLRPDGGGCQDLPQPSTGCACRRLRGPAEICAELDTTLLRLASQKFVTAVVGQICVRTGEIAYCRAGHPVPLVQTAGGHMLRLDQGGGPPMGLGLGLPFVSGSYRLKPNERLFVYSDGMVELPNPEGRLFGDDGLESMLRVTHGLPLGRQVRACLRGIRHHLGDGHATDDITLVALEFSQ